MPTRKRRGDGKEREEGEEGGVERGRGRREGEVGGLIGDDNGFDASVVAAAFPSLICLFELAGLFFAVFVFVSFVANEDLPPRLVAGAFLLLAFKVVGFFETDAIVGGDDDDESFFFVFVAFAFAPAALPDERMLRAIAAKNEKGIGAGSSQKKESKNVVDCFYLFQRLWKKMNKKMKKKTLDPRQFFFFDSTQACAFLFPFCNSQTHESDGGASLKTT